MKPKVGLWIDHKRAVIVILANEREEIKQIRSHVEKHRSRSGDSPLKGPYEAQAVAADDSQQRSFTGHLNVYYDHVIDAIGDAEALLILGPGEAKGELKKRIEGKNHSEYLVSVRAVGKMTHHQIATAVREYFDVPTASQAVANTSASYQLKKTPSLKSLLSGLRML